MTTPDWADEEAEQLLVTSFSRPTFIASALRAAFLRGRIAGLREAAEIAEGYTDWGDNWGQYNNLATAQIASREIDQKIRAAADKLEKGEA